MQRRHLEQLVQYDIGVGVLLNVYYYPHAVVVRLVVDIADSVEPPLLHQVGDILYELCLVDTVGYLGDDNLVVRLAALYFGLGAHYYAPAPRLVGVAHSLYAVDVCPGGEVGRLDVLHQSVGVDVGIVYVGAATVYHLAEVVRRYVGGHAHGYSVAAVDEQVGYFRRHDGRLLQGVIKVVGHVDGVLVEVVHDVLAHLRQAALGVSHGRRRVAVNAAEVTLAVNERVAHVPVLRHAHQRSVD